MKELPPLSHSWSDLTWQQLCQCWETKMRYGGNPDVARAAALLSLLGCSVGRDGIATDMTTGETRYTLSAADGRRFTVTPRELAWIAKKALPWFDYPYGDMGEKEERDEQGKVLKEGREAVNGYVSGFRDAMILPETEVVVVGDRLLSGSEWERMSEKGRKYPALHFALPQMACNNITWQQYRSMQALAPQLFREGISEEETLDLQAQFLAHCLVPSKEDAANDDQFRPRHIYRYDAERAEQTIHFWKEKLKTLSPLPRDREGFAPLKWLRRFRRNAQPLPSITGGVVGGCLFHICFQCYQTALQYYSQAYPLLFQDSGKSDPLRDALTGEVGTINTVMKYTGYSDQQQVYDSNLPFVLDILNTMTKEAKEIEKMNSKIKKK